jgi:FixJ family two-component response regulator
MSDDTPIVFVVNDDAQVRSLLSSVTASAGFRVMAFASPRDFLESARPDAPACLVLDLNLPDVSGIELQRELSRSAGLPIVFIAQHCDVPSSVRVMKAGAVELLSAPFSTPEVQRALDAAIALDRLARDRRAELAQLQTKYERLTPREREVLRYVVAGFANKQTASDLGTSEITIGVHRGQIMRKMAVRSLADLVRMTDKLGIRPHDRPCK